MAIEITNPVKLDDETVKKIEDAFAMDCSVSEACLLANISRPTYYNWIKSFPELEERFNILKDNLKVKSKAIIRKQIEEKQDKDTAKWYLEKRDKDFKPKQDVSFEDPVPLLVRILNKEDETNNNGNTTGVSETV